MSSGYIQECPDCGDVPVTREWTWKGILLAIFCFPCGIWCCLRRNTNMQCQHCGCDVVRRSSAETTRIMNHGYHFKGDYKTNLAPEKALMYRNKAATISTQASTYSVNTANSEMPLIPSNEM